MDECDSTEKPRTVDESDNIEQPCTVDEWDSTEKPGTSPKYSTTQCHPRKPFTRNKIKCVFCSKDSFEINNKKKEKQFMTKKKCKFVARCKLCHTTSCFFCIDAILNKIQVQCRSDAWYQHFNALRQEYQLLKEQGDKKGMIECNFCHACEYKKNLHSLHFAACYEDEENIGYDYDSEEDLFEVSNIENVIDDVSRLSIDSLNLRQMQHEVFLPKKKKYMNPQPAKKLCLMSGDSCSKSNMKNVSYLYFISFIC